MLRSLRMSGHTRMLLPLALALILATFATFSTVSSAKAAAWCWCTDYVANHDNLTRNYPNANQWGNGYLQSNGYYQEPDNTINGWDIIVFQANVTIWVTNPATGGSFNWSTGGVGHVAIVSHITLHNTVPRYYTVTIQGANQGVSGEFTDANCTNVTDLTWNVDGNSSGQYAFWR